MKKKIYLIPLLLISLFFGSSIVKADSVETFYYSSCSTSCMTFDQTYSYYDNRTYNFSDLYSEWLSTYSISYPYFIYTGDELLLYSSLPSLIQDQNYSNQYYYSYSHRLTYNDNTFNLSNDTGDLYLLDLSSNHNMIYASAYLYANFTFNFPVVYDRYELSFLVDNQPDPSAREYDVLPSEGIPTMSTYLNLNIFNDDVVENYQEINLNNYSYIILTLKDYSLRNDEINQFYSNIYTYGSLCLTSVYDYGMKQKNEYYSDYQTPSCSTYYNSFTPVQVYVLKQDLQNHAVYYVSSSDKSITNTIKIDTSVFDIYYFTPSNEDNPSVVINGRSYPSIPYSDLTDTAIISTDEGYVSGVVCAVGDVNCYYQQTGIDISNLFTHPLDLLETTWNSISTMFVLISTFLSLLPVTLQTFLFSGFMLAIVLGILKIIIS